MRANCLNWPVMSCQNGYALASASNSSKVSNRISYKCGKTAWSSVGNRWCRTWSPKWVIARIVFWQVSLRSMTVSMVYKPQSKSSLRFRLSYELDAFKKTEENFQRGYFKIVLPDCIPFMKNLEKTKGSNINKNIKANFRMHAETYMRMMVASVETWWRKMNELRVELWMQVHTNLLRQTWN